MFISDSTFEYIFTIGMLVSFVGFVLLVIINRKTILEMISHTQVNRKTIIAALLITILFLLLEIFIVKQTQQLFFDDVIYQGGAQMLLKTGQAWMCNFGGPNGCISGQIFHEPIGTSFILAIGFLFFGIGRESAFWEYIIISTLSVFLIFVASLLLFKKKEIALFAQITFALLPILLVWAAPTTSDLLMMFFSIICFIGIIIFAHKNNLRTFLLVVFSLLVLLYMKIDALMYIPIFGIVYLALRQGHIKGFVNDVQTLFKKFNLWHVIIFVILLFGFIPALLYFQNQYNNGYGYQGTTITNTCNNNKAIQVTDALGLKNFEANICANTLFWFNTYGNSNYYVMQPVFLTALALLGAMLMIDKHKWELLAVGSWFLIIFLVYTSFYAGSVLFGVDWRFFLALMPPFALFAGFGVGKIAMLRIFRKKTYRYVLFAIIVFIMLFSTLYMYNLLGVNPANISQAQNARFYENFIYNNSHKISNSCLVFSFDPTLFNINNKTSAQMSYLTNINQGVYNQYHSAHSCLVLDYGFWCYTPEGEALCNSILNATNTTPIATIVDNNTMQKFELLNITGFR